MSPNPHGAAVEGRALARFGATVRELRIARGLTGAALGKRVHMSQPQISRIELGQHRLSDDDVVRIADALELDRMERNELLDQYSTLGLASGNYRLIKFIGATQGMQDYAELERHAKTNRIFDMQVIPGLMQTERYVRGMFLHFGTFLRDNADLETAVRVRMERQRILWQAGRSFEFLLFETVLYARYCPLEDHLAQLDRVRTLAQRGNIKVGIVPARITPPGALSSFSMLDNLGVNVEILTEAAWVNNPYDIARYHEQFDALSRLAVSGVVEVAAKVAEAMEHAEANSEGPSDAAPSPSQLRLHGEADH